jgi:hypothetical protein
VDSSARVPSAARCGRSVHVTDGSPQNTAPTAPLGWFKAVRCDDAIELIRANPLAFALLYVIAYRAKWRPGFNAQGLEQGECQLGDFENYGMSARQYRTAKHQLSKWGFATFKATNKGTIARLLDSRLFVLSVDSSDRQPAIRQTDSRQASDRQATTNEESKKERRETNHVSLSGHAIKNPVLIELMQMAAEVLGPKEMGLNHQRWLKRAQSEPGKLRRVLADTRMKIREEGLDNPAAWAETMWGKVFK